MGRRIAAAFSADEVQVFTFILGNVKRTARVRPSLYMQTDECDVLHARSVS
jgi:hypothetical protein